MSTSQTEQVGVKTVTLLPQARAQLLANLEHELRLSRHPVWLGPADGQHERYLRISRRACRPDSDPLACRAVDRASDSTAHRPRQRSHLGTPRTAPALLPCWRNPQFPDAHSHAERIGSLDGSRHAVDSRRLHQCQHGAISRVCRRHSAGRPAHFWFCHAKPVHRAGCSRCVGASLCAH